MQVFSHAVFPLAYEADGKLYSRFPAALYSQYKYGSAQAAQQLGELLFDTAYARFGNWLREEALYVSASAYKAVPTAAQQLANVFIQKLFAHDIFPHAFTIGRKEVFCGDYGKLQRTEREELMQANELVCFTPLSGKRVLIIDDVYITGSHEQRVRRMLQELGVETVVHLYVGKTVDTHVDGMLEHKLNHTWVSNVWDLRALIEEDDWTVNARVCKFLLSTTDADEVRTFWQSLPTCHRISIVHAMEADGYAQMADYAARYAWLAAHVYHEHTDIGLPHTGYAASLS